MTKSKISSLIETIFSQATYSPQIISKFGISYTLFGNNKSSYAVSGHAELMPSIGFAIPYYGSITMGISGELTLANVPTKIKTISLKESYNKKFTDLMNYGTLEDHKIKFEKKSEPALTYYNNDFSNVPFVIKAANMKDSTLSKYNDDQITGKSDLEKESNAFISEIITSEDNKRNYLILTSSEGIKKFTTSKESFTNIIKSKATKTFVDNDKNIVNVLKPDVKSNAILGSDVNFYGFRVEDSRTQILTDSEITRIKRDIEGMDKIISEITSSTDEKLAFVDFKDKIKPVLVTTSSETTKSKAEAIAEIQKQKSEAQAKIINWEPSAIDVQLEAAQKKLVDSIKESVKAEFSKNPDSHKVTVQSSLIELPKDNLESFMNKISTLSASITLPSQTLNVAGHSLNVEVGSTFSTLDSTPYELKVNDSRRFSMLVSIFKGINFGLNINKSFGVVKGFGLNVQVSLADYISDSIKSKTYYNIMNSNKLERKNLKIDHATAKEISKTISDKTMSAAYLSVANAESSKASNSFKVIDEKDWDTVKTIESDYKSVLNVVSSSNKIGLTLYFDLFGGFGVNLSFSIPSINSAKLSDYYFIQASLVKVLYGNPLADDSMSISTSIESEAESKGVEVV